MWRATKIQPPMPCDSCPRAAGAMPAECALDVCYGCMEKNKKSPRWGCEGWRPFVGVMSKSNVKQAPPLSFAFTPTVARHARHSPPSPLRKKSRFAKKSRLRRKKHAYHKNYYSIVWKVGACHRHVIPAYPTIRQPTTCRGASFLGSGPTHCMPQLLLSTNTILSCKL